MNLLTLALPVLAVGALYGARRSLNYARLVGDGCRRWTAQHPAVRQAGVSAFLTMVFALFCAVAAGIVIGALS